MRYISCVRFIHIVQSGKTKDFAILFWCRNCINTFINGFDSVFCRCFCCQNRTATLVKNWVIVFIQQFICCSRTCYGGLHFKIRMNFCHVEIIVFPLIGSVVQLQCHGFTNNAANRKAATFCTIRKSTIFAHDFVFDCFYSSVRKGDFHFLPGSFSVL